MTALTDSQYDRIKAKIMMIDPHWEGFTALPEDMMDAMSPCRDRSDFYVYILLDPRHEGVYRYYPWKFRHKPFYVGKGTADRINGKKNVYAERKIASIMSSGLSLISFKVAKGLTEEQAFRLERGLIKLIGLENLTNLCHGGEGASGAKWSKAARKAKSKQTKAWLASMTDEERQELAAKRSSAVSKETRLRSAQKQSVTWALMDKKKKESHRTKSIAAAKSWWSTPAGLAERKRRSIIQAERNRQRARA